MKIKLNSSILIISFFLLFSCSLNEVDTFRENSVGVENYRVSEESALSIAESMFAEVNRTKSLSFNVDYILHDGGIATKSAQIDTLAYIFNVLDDGGFVIVSADARTVPVLAYSETGNFEYEESQEDIVYSNFVSCIDEYIAEVSESRSPSLDLSSDQIGIYTYVAPKLYTNWDQGAPYDKYVIQEYEGCPVGCVAVAIGQIMVYCRHRLDDYHGMTFYLSSINNAFKEASGWGSWIDEDRDNHYGPRCTYNEAVDYSAKLLYYIGQDVDMSYAPDGSSASNAKALQLFKDLDFMIKEGRLTPFSGIDIAHSLDDGHIVYITGYRPGAGHAWVVDGCAYIKYGVVAKLQQYYLHCNWGWGGSRNGFYYGEVFKVGSREYGNMSYFSVKIEY